MKSFFLLFAVLFFSFSADAQFKSRILKKGMELKMPKTIDDDMPGTRGAGVVWHPTQKKYYASFAGNVSFPFAVFSPSGTLLSGEDVTALADVRGLWYNPATKQIHGNGYNTFGWYHYTLDNAGIINELEVDFEGMHQPNDQAAGTYNAFSKKINFISNDSVFFYTLQGKATDSVVLLNLGRTKDQGIDQDEEDRYDRVLEYNYTSLIFTGIVGSEIGVLNTVSKQVELYNIKSGFLTQKLKLPDGIKAESVFNFAFANGYYWFFDIPSRTWIGCK